MFLSLVFVQECLEFTLFPELIATLLYVEALEDNEVVFVENVRQFNRISTDSNKQPYLQSLDQPKKVRNVPFVLVLLLNLYEIHIKFLLNQYFK